MADTETWGWSEHACRRCMSVLVERRQAGGLPTIFECGTCRESALGTPDGVCGCGALPPSSRSSLPGAKASSPRPRFRCVANDAPTASQTAAVLIRWGIHA
jgi:hypothetical protein